MKPKSQQFTAQLDFYQPVQLGIDLRTDEQKAAAAEVVCKTTLLSTTVYAPTFKYWQIGEGMGWLRIEHGSSDRADHCTGPDDTSPHHVCLAGDGYDPDCNHCWLNIPHTEDMHTRSLAEK